MEKSYIITHAQFPKEDRVLFIKRYYYGDAVKKLAKVTGYSMINARYHLRTLPHLPGQ